MIVAQFIGLLHTYGSITNFSGTPLDKTNKHLTPPIAVLCIVHVDVNAFNHTHSKG